MRKYIHEDENEQVRELIQFKNMVT